MGGLPSHLTSETAGCALQVVLDFSRAASMDDIRPSRGRHLLDLTRQFIREFFDQNPLSHLSLVIMRHGRAEMLSSLSGSPVSSCWPGHTKTQAVGNPFLLLSPIKLGSETAGQGAHKLSQSIATPLCPLHPQRMTMNCWARGASHWRVQDVVVPVTLSTAVSAACIPAV